MATSVMEVSAAEALKSSPLGRLAARVGAEDSGAEPLKSGEFTKIVLENSAMVNASTCDTRGVSIFLSPLGTPASTVNSAFVSDYLFSFEKRVLDVCGATFALVLSIPVLLLVAVLIKVSSRGPVLFMQKRNGAAGRTFTVLKFRSMTLASCRDERVEQATRNDARITTVGRFIRRTSIDELPQLLNVLKGDMSLIGPRPHAVEHDRFYSSKIALYPWRFAAKPGLSGLAQTSGARGETRQMSDMERRVTLDLEYINQASLLKDLRIVVATCREMLFSSSAY